MTTVERYEGLLDGVRVIEFSQFYAGPIAGRVLAEMGAEVILLEQPDRVDLPRRNATIGGASFATPDGKNLLFEGIHRGKKSVCIDLRTERGREAVHRLVRNSDVFLTNYRQSALVQAGLGYDTLAQINPRIIYARISGFGPEGPLKDHGAFDFIMQGFSGMMAAMGDENAELAPPLLLVVDQMTGVLAAYSVVAALLYRERRGTGQEVHTSLLGTTVQLLYFHFFAALHGKELEKHSRAKPGNALRNYYRCADGKWIILAHNPKERYWNRFREAVGLTEALLSDQLRDDEGDRRLTDLLDQVFASRPREEWLKILWNNGLICAPINSVPEAVKEEQVLVNYVEEVVMQEGKVRYPGFCTHFSGTTLQKLGKAPAPGEHTAEVMRTLGGYSEEEVKRLEKTGVIKTQS
jgi:crotonobetainyl-CoA:carnitine CoA-transferase CaiB-like acyl-CoA transferase